MTNNTTTLSTCGTCLRSWDDSKPTSLTPAPSGRCPFEYFHDGVLVPEDHPVQPAEPDRRVEIYLPVAVFVVNGRVVSANVDFDGAPWMYVGDNENAWSPDAKGGEGAWENTRLDDDEEPTWAEEEENAIEWIQDVTRRALDV